MSLDLLMMGSKLRRFRNQVEASLDEVSAATGISTKLLDDLCLSACFSRPQWVVSWDASTEFPQEPAAVPTTVCQRGRLRGVSDGMPLARWVPVSEVRSDVRVRLGRPPALAVCLLPLSGLCDGRDNPPQFEDPAHDVVLGCVSDDDG